MMLALTKMFAVHTVGAAGAAARAQWRDLGGGGEPRTWTTPHQVVPYFGEAYVLVEAENFTVAVAIGRRVT
jgi:hypothetical protein